MGHDNIMTDTHPKSGSNPNLPGCKEEVEDFFEVLCGNTATVIGKAHNHPVITAPAAFYKFTSLNYNGSQGLYSRGCIK